MSSKSAIYVGQDQAGGPVGDVQLSFILDGHTHSATFTETLIVYRNKAIFIHSARVARVIDGHTWLGWCWRKAKGCLPELRLLLQVGDVALPTSALERCVQ